MSLGSYIELRLRTIRGNPKIKKSKKVKKKGSKMSWTNTMKSFRFVIEHPITGKNWSFTDHLSIADESKSWYITKRMKKMFEWKDTGKVVRISQDVSGLGRRFKMVYSESKGWVGADLTKVNPYN